MRKQRLPALLICLLPVAAYAQAYVEGFGSSEVIDVSPPPIVQESTTSTPDASDFYTSPETATPTTAPVPTAHPAPFAVGEHSQAAVPEEAIIEQEEEFKPASEQIVNTVVMQGLNKVNGHISRLETRISSPVRFDYLEITPHRCWKAPPEERAENAVLVEIKELKKKAEPKRVFLGWIFSSSPGLSGLEHPLYDIRILSCTYNVVMPEKKDGEAEATDKSKEAASKEATPTAKKEADKPAAVAADKSKKSE